MDDDTNVMANIFDAYVTGWPAVSALSPRPSDGHLVEGPATQRPPLPLILGAWSSTDYEKRSRLIEQLHWARDNGCLLVATSILLALPPFFWTRHVPQGPIEWDDSLRVTDPC